MSSVIVLPSTEDGIKRLAKQIKRAHGIPHHEALDLAAREVGFQNFRHAQRQLATGPLYRVYLTAHWRDQRAAGRETLTIEVSRPLGEIVARHQLNHVRQLVGFKLEYDDHLERAVDIRGQDAARDVLVAAGRALQFMAATELRPATTQLQRRRMRGLAALPSRDHASLWVHPSGAWVHLDEPYDHDEKGSLLAQRAPLVSKEGAHQLAPEWSGLYSPSDAKPFFVSNSAAVLVAIDRQLALLEKTNPPPGWTGESAPYFSSFSSPGRQAAGTERKRRAVQPRPGTPRGRAVAYYPELGNGIARWRPDGRMPLAAHLETGRLLKALEASLASDRLRRLVSQVKCDLDDWVQREYPGDQLDAEVFHGMYYGGRPVEIDHEAQLHACHVVRTALTTHYPECSALREQLRRLDKVEASIRKAALVVQ